MEIIINGKESFMENEEFTPDEAKDFKPTELEQVMETDATSEYLGQMKNDDGGPINTFTREIADKEYIDREGTAIDASTPGAADHIRETGSLRENILDPEEADSKTEFNIVDRLTKNTEEGGIRQGEIYNENIQRIFNVNDTKKAVEELKKSQDAKKFTPGAINTYKPFTPEAIKDNKPTPE